jgi:methyl-accepting chemotaxis protein
MANDTTIRISAIDQTREAFRSVQSNISGLTGSLKGIAGPLAAAFSTVAITTFAKSVIDTADALGDLSEKTGITVKELSALGNAAQFNGSSAEEFNDAIVKFQKSLAEAQKGIGSQSDAFKTLGISLKDSDGAYKDTTSLFYEFVDAMAVTAEGATKTKLAQDLLGRSGTNLIPVLNQGSNALKQYQATFDDDFVKRAGEFNDNLDKLSKKLQSVAVTLLGPVVEGFNKFFEFIERGANREAIAGTFDAFTGDLPQRMEATAGAAAKVGGATQKMTRTLIDSAKAAQEQAKEIERLIAISKDYSDRTDRIFQQQATAQKGAEERSRQAAKYLQDIQTPAQKYAEELAKVNVLNEEGRFSTEEYALVLKKLRENFAESSGGLIQYSEASKDLNRNLQNVAVSGLRRMEDALLGVMTGTMSVKDAFRSMAISIIQDLIRIQIQRSITGPLADALGGLLGGGVQTTGGNLGSGLRVPGAAIGGSVSAGSPYVVGERGPELFVPNASGSIIANDKMGGGAPTIVQNINISTGVSQTVRAEIIGMLPKIMEATKAAVVDQKRRGGSFAKAFT